MGVSAGTSFSAPWFIGTVQGTLAPFRYSFLEIGLDFGFLSGAADVEYFSLYPFVHYAFYMPVSFTKGGWYAGLGAGIVYYG